MAPRRTSWGPSPRLAAPRPGAAGQLHSLYGRPQARYGPGMTSRTHPARVAILALASLIGGAGCASMIPSIHAREADFQAITAGAIGCPAEEITITGLKTEYRIGDGPPTWRATCRGHHFICSSGNKTLNCAEELKPAP